MTFVRLNQNYFLSNEDIGSLICVKMLNHYYNEIEEYQNSIILEFKYNKNNLQNKHNIRPTHMLILTEKGIKKFIRLDYSKSDIEIKFLSRPKRILLNE